MFVPPTDLSPDLEWMLLSDQAPQEMLLEALVSEFYAPVYHLSLSMQDDPQSARLAALETIGLVLTDAYRYRGGIDVKIWLYGIALSVSRRALRARTWKRAFGTSASPSLSAGVQQQATPEISCIAELWPIIVKLRGRKRLLVLLHDLHAWEPADIAQLFSFSEAQVIRELAKAHESLQAAWERVSLPAGLGRCMQGEEFREVLSRCLSWRWPVPKFSTDELETATRLIQAQAQRVNVRRRRVSQLREVAAIVIVILVMAGIGWWLEALTTEESASQPLATVLVTEIVYVTSVHSTPQPSPTPQAPGETRTPPPSEAFYVAKVGDTFWSVAANLDTSPEELVALNRISAGTSLQAGQQLLIPGYLPHTPAAATTVPPSPRLEPLESPYNSQDLLQRIKLGDTLFNTLWFDAQIVDYGPSGYIGPPEVLRAQVWMSLDQFLILIGDPYRPQEVLLQNDYYVYLANPDEAQPWFYSWEQREDSLLDELMPYFRNLLYSNSSLTAGTIFQATRRDEWAGQQALVIDQLDPSDQLLARLWLDDRTGVLLRKQWYEIGKPETLTREIAITKVAYDIDFPQALFDPRLPWRGGYANDHTGSPVPPIGAYWPFPQGRQRLEISPPAEGFEVSRSQLSFQYPHDFDGRVYQNSKVSLFADGAYLGSINFGNPWSMICQRSPDGRRIAYVSYPSRQPSPASMLHWFSLDNPTSDYPQNLITDIAVTQFAWAPDNNRLALFGYESGQTYGQLLVLDTQQGQVKKILSLADAKSLVWSPDGEQIAMIARYQPSSYNEDVISIRADDGEILYSASIDFGSGKSTHWPTLDWDTPFPVQMGGLASCAAAPK